MTDVEAPDLVEPASPTPVDIVYVPLGAAAFGGAERSILELAAAQRRTGKRVLVCCEKALGATDFPNECRALGLPLVKVDWSPEAPVRRIFAAARRFFARIDASLVHFNISWRSGMWCVPLAARMVTNARLVGTMRAMPEPFSDLPHKTYLGFVPGPRVWAWADYVTGRVWARTLHATVSVNRDDYPPRLVRAFGFSASRMRVVYNGVRIPATAPTAAERRAARVALGLDPAELVVAYVGRVSPEKGVRFLIDAVARCRHPLRLVVAGDGADLEPMRRHARQLGLADRVDFLGYVSPAASVFTAADVVVVPSIWNEAFGRVVVEAMACGATVIATAVGGMQEIFQDRRQGLLVPKGDAEAIARALDELVADPLWRAELSAAGFAHAKHAFSTERVAEEYGALYAGLLRQPMPCATSSS